MSMIPTSHLLMAELVDAGAPLWMVDKANAGEYDDYKAKNTATPCVDLVNDLARVTALSTNQPPLVALRERALKGEFDAQKWESDAWAESMKDDPEMGPLLRQMGMM